MPQYKVLTKSFVDNHIREEGDVVEYAGYPSANLEPLDDEGKAMAKEGVKVAKAAQRDLEKNVTPLGGLDQDSFAKAIAKAIVDGNAALLAKTSEAPLT